MAEQDDRILQILRDFERAARNRGVWESHWEEIAERLLPAYVGQFTGDKQTPGQKNTREIFSTAPITALNRFAAVMESILTPRSSKWHTLVAGEKAIRQDREVALYFEALTDLLFQRRYAPKANFASQNHQNYIGLGGFGTGCLFTDDLFGRVGLRYRAIHLAEIYFVENHQGVIDTAYRLFEMTARQMKQRWGEDALPDRVKTSTDPEKKFEILHCVKPREDADPERADYRGMAWVSYYIAKEAKALLSEGGYNTFPYAISRYTQAPGELYGRSPAMEALPAIKTLNEQKRTMLKVGHKRTDPVLLAHDDGVLDTFSLRPGAVNYGGVTAEGRPLVHPLPVGDPAAGEKAMEMELAEINDAFLIDLLRVLVENPNMTATQALEIVRERGVILSPTAGRQETEYLGTLIEREVDLLAQQGILPPMPELLVEAGGTYAVEYHSPLSHAQKAEEAVGLTRSVDLVIPYIQATQDPTSLDWIDWDQAMPALMEIQGVPPSWTRSKQMVEVIREQRAQQAAAASAVDGAPAAAQLLRAANEVQTA
jgi:hypothetical protein